MSKGIEEVTEEIFDSILCGSYLIIKILAQNFISLPQVQSLFFSEKFINRMLTDCMFRRENDQASGLMYPLSKHKETRKFCGQLITKLGELNGNILMTIANHL